MQYLLGNCFRHAESVWSLEAAVRWTSIWLSPPYFVQIKEKVNQYSLRWLTFYWIYNNILPLKKFTWCKFRHCPVSVWSKSKFWSISPKKLASGCGKSKLFGSFGWAGSSVPCKIKPHCVTWAKFKRKKKRIAKANWIKMSNWCNIAI